MTRWFIDYTLLIEDGLGELVIEDEIFDVIEGRHFDDAINIGLQQSVHKSAESYAHPGMTMNIEVRINRTMKIDEEYMKQLVGA